MADKKITRHNHPLMVNARKAAYMAGKADGYLEGYQQGYANRCADLYRSYRTLIEVAQVKLDVANERIRILEEEAKHNG